jgi:putative polyketide hydroxylase
LLAGPDGAVWADVANRAPAARAFGVTCHRIGPGGDLHDVHDRWSSAYGVGAAGAVLIRPDGFIAWRGGDAADQTQRSFARALDQVRDAT